MKCAKCGEGKAPHNWQVSICADDRRKRSRYLCNKCDVGLNEMVLAYFNYPYAEEKIKVYKEKVDD